jgi:dihydroorotate dehydrogenase (fumarate)
MDLSVTYLGLTLPHPLIPGASPMVDDLDVVQRLAEAGAPAITMHSLFEEQIVHEQMAELHLMEAPSNSFSEALSFFPRASEYKLGPDEYLEQIGRIKRATSLPVIGSLNGVTSGGWVRYARYIEDAGADALEMNVYYLPTDPRETAADVERRTLDILRAVKSSVTIPVAVKLSQFFSALPHFAAELDAAGADGIILFNRFYQPDLDVEELTVVPTVRLSTSAELLLRLRWLAILSGHVSAALAVSGGVHTALDAVKAIMTGATAVQTVSSLLRNGPEYLRTMREELAHWLLDHEYDSLAQMRGSMNLLRCPDPAGFERSNYIRVLQGWRG